MKIEDVKIGLRVIPFQKPFLVHWKILTFGKGQKITISLICMLLIVIMNSIVLY